MSKIKIVCKVEWNGDVYEGVTLNDGVTVDIQDACVEGAKALVFSNCDKAVTLMYNHVQSISINEVSSNAFLELLPVEPPVAE